MLRRGGVAGPVIICGATYVIGLTDIIYEKGETETGTSVCLQQVPAACRDWTRLADDAGDWRQSLKLPSLSPRPSFFQPGRIGAEQNGDIWRNSEEKLPCGVNKSSERFCDDWFSMGPGYGYRLQATIDMAGTGSLAVEVFDIGRHFE